MVERISENARMSNKQKNPEPIKIPGLLKRFGGVLLSHTAARAVPSARKSLTSVFEMGTGVASSLLPPKNDYARYIICIKTRNLYNSWIIQYDHMNYFVAKPHDLLVPVS